MDACSGSGNRQENMGDWKRKWSHSCLVVTQGAVTNEVRWQNDQGNWKKWSERKWQCGKIGTRPVQGLVGVMDFCFGGYEKIGISLAPIDAAKDISW